MAESSGKYCLLARPAGVKRLDLNHRRPPDRSLRRHDRQPLDVRSDVNQSTAHLDRMTEVVEEIEIAISVSKLHCRGSPDVETGRRGRRSERICADADEPGTP